jgi:adenylosuccinate lyase
MPVGYTYLALQSLNSGLQKITVNEQRIHEDLNNNWAVLAEPIQTVLRKVGYPNPYETLKAFTRKPHKLTQADLTEFVDSLELDEAHKEQLKALTPANYTGINPEF